MAERDPEYTARNYRLRPSDLIEAAQQLAVLFAESPALSLAPTQDDIERAFAELGVALDDLPRIVAALVDVKIGRCDVREARPGDQRFTFAHRRYQETLYVLHLAQHPDAKSPRDLLTDLRWREYVVTLLQSQPLDVIRPLITAACELLKEYARDDSTREILPQMGGGLTYYEWQDRPATMLMRTLQEGLANRLADVPDELRSAIFAFLDPRSRSDDIYDRYMAIEFGGLLPENTLAGLLKWAVSDGPDSVKGAAFKQTGFLQHASEELKRWITSRVALEVLSCHSRIELLKVEAQSLRLPSDFGATVVMARYRRLRPLTLSGGMFRHEMRRFAIPFTQMLVLYVLLLCATLCLAGGVVLGKTLGDYILGGLLSASGVFACTLAGIRTIFLTIPDRITSRFFWARALDDFASGAASIRGVFTSRRLVPVHAAVLGVGVLTFLYPLLAVGAIAVGYISLVAGVLGYAVYFEFRATKMLRSAVSHANQNVAAVLQAESARELLYWLRKDVETLLPTPEHTRSLCRILSCKERPKLSFATDPPILRWRWNPSFVLWQRTINLLIEKIDQRNKDKPDSFDTSATNEQNVLESTVALGKQTGRTMKDFFVSYNGNDRHWAEWIAWTLEKAGYTTVIQAWDFRAGGDFVMEMQKAATGTRKTIAVLSDNYLRAEYTQPEWGNAFARDPQGHQRTLIPVRVEPCKPDGLLATRIYVDLVGLSADEAREKLIEALKDRGKPASSPAFPGSGRQPQTAPATVSAPPRSFPGSASGAVDVWREKLEFLRMQEPLIVAADQKFALKKQIEEAERKIRELGG